MNYQEPKRFMRSTRNKVFAGVAGGLGEYFNVDPVILRVIFVLLALFGGGGVLIYIILWIALPEDLNFRYNYYNYSAYSSPSSPPPSEETKTEAAGNEDIDPEKKAEDRTYSPPLNPEVKKGGLIAGIILIVVGGLFLIRQLDLIPFRDIWPALFILGGLALIINSSVKSK